MTESLSLYWKYYGGFKELFTSPFFYAAWIITFVLFPHWTQPNWWNTTLAIIPSLLGFTLGGYALMIAIGDESFKRLLAGNDDKGNLSLYLQVSAAFVHFLILQILALVAALCAEAYYLRISEVLPVLHGLGLGGEVILWALITLSCVAYFLFIYSIISVLAATLVVFELSTWYEEKVQMDIESEAERHSKDTNGGNTRK